MLKFKSKFSLLADSEEENQMINNEKVIRKLRQLKTISISNAQSFPKKKKFKCNNINNRLSRFSSMLSSPTRKEKKTMRFYPQINETYSNTIIIPKKEKNNILN